MSSPTVTVLGSSGTFAHAGNACSGYLVRTPTTSIWVDAGPGTLGPLQEHVALSDLDAVVISHVHPDHWLELPVLRNALKHVLHREGLPVYGPAEVLEAGVQLVGDRLAPHLVWHLVGDGEEHRIGDATFRFSATDHPAETMGMRIEAAGRVLGYTADTGPGWSLASLDPEGAGFDLALCEATLRPDEGGPGQVQHCTGAQAGRMARDAGVRRLVITHLLAGAAESRRAEAAEAFGDPVEVAEPGVTFTV